MGGASTTTSTRPQDRLASTTVLTISADPDLTDQVERALAAAGTSGEQVSVDQVDRQQWRQAGRILLDPQAMPALLERGLPARRELTVLCRSPLTDNLWAHCVQLGVARVLDLVGEPAALVELLSTATEQTADPHGRIVGFLSASGGAGSSILAAATAVAASRAQRQTLLVDCDQWGAGLDVVLGVEHQAGLRWNDLAAPAGRLSAEHLYQSLPVWNTSAGGVPLVCYPCGAAREVDPAVAATVVATARRCGDLAVVDLPRMRTEVGQAIAELADLVVVVVTADVRSCHAARRQVDWLAGQGIRCALVVRGPSPGGLGADDIADALGVPVLATMRPDRRLLHDLEFGRPPGLDRGRPIARAARSVLRVVDPVLA